MIRDNYTLLSVVGAAAFATLAVWAFRSGGQPRLWAAWLGATAVLAAVILSQAQQLANGETPLRAYWLVAIVPTLAATLFVNFTGRSRQPAALQLLGAGAICWVLIPGMLLFGLYGVGG